MKAQGESIEARLDAVRGAVDSLFRKSSGELNDMGVMWTFEDAVIVKDYRNGKLYELPYVTVAEGIKFGDPREVDQFFVTKKLEALEATPEEVVRILTASKYAPVELTGPIVVKNAALKIAYAAVLVPGERDVDGDVVTAEKIEEVAHKWMEMYRNVDVDHSLNNVGTPVESFLLPMPMTVKVDSEDVELPIGTWILASKLDDATWARVEKGELTGYSIMGIPKDAKMAAKKSVSGDITAALKKTLLKDLGPDWIVHTVSVVDAPAVPKAKFYCLKSQVAKSTFVDKLKSILPGQPIVVDKEGRKYSKVTYETLKRAFEALGEIINEADAEVKSREKSREDKVVKDLTPEDIATAVKSGISCALKAEYPWDECIADMMERYGDEEIAEKICGTIRARSLGYLSESEAIALEKELFVDKADLTKVPQPEDGETKAAYIKRMMKDETMHKMYPAPKILSGVANAA